MDRMEQVVEQFKSAGTYIIVMPLHNFNIPSKLKDYMDNILIARKTFVYTKNGSVGLLKNEGRRALLIQGSGAVYTNNDWYTEVEFSYKYLQSMFQFIGVEDFEIVRAQGTNRSIGVPERLEEAYKKVNEAAHRLADEQHPPTPCGSAGFLNEYVQKSYKNLSSTNWEPLNRW
ncbi:hypothetical protein INT45_006700 [Circinella minor]|uniref:Flavodoxin-like fold domain-containing protein n=1 Tax=Circinella minor TaxID=1195481 RepID=A0A8H7S4G4_9FUNG|nr:hypothetical protein INT45_006700 [Circinella minor]